MKTEGLYVYFTAFEQFESYYSVERSAVSTGSSSFQKDSLEIVMENNPHPMWIFDHATLDFLEVNPAAISKYGYSRSEFLKMKITGIQPKEQIPVLLAGIRPFQLNGACITHRKHLTKDGRKIDVEITACQFYFKNKPAVLVQALDVTEQRKDQVAQRTLAVLNDQNPEIKILTARELEVLHFLTKGKTNKEIGNCLGLKEGTVKIHINHILHKLRAETRTEASVIALKNRLVPLE